MTAVAAEDLLRELAPQVLGGLLSRGAGFAEAEDAVQEAVVEALSRWPEAGLPDRPLAWLAAVARNKLIDAVRSEAARRRREVTDFLEPAPGEAPGGDDTLRLLFLCCHPTLATPAAVALTLRAVGGLTTREIAAAYLLPEATVGQRISRAKRTLAGVSLGETGDLPVVLRVLYLIFNEGYTETARVDLAVEAIRLARLLHRELPEPEVAGLLALMLLHHARRPARLDDTGGLVPLDGQDRSRWDTALIAEGVGILQAALADQQHGEYQVQAAIAALHDDAPSVAETDWPQILAWYDELLALTHNPLVALSRAVAVGEVHGPREGLRALDPLAGVLAGHHRLGAVRAHLLERTGDPTGAASLFAAAAHAAPSLAERNHLLGRGSRLTDAGRPADVTSETPDEMLAARDHERVPGRIG